MAGIVKPIRDAIFYLKKMGQMDPWHTPLEFQLVDQDFDLRIDVSLIPKKQKARASESAESPAVPGGNTIGEDKSGAAGSKLT